MRYSQELLDIKSVFEEQLDISKQKVQPLFDRCFPLDTSALTRERSGEYIQLSKSVLADAEWARMLDRLCENTRLEGAKHRIRTLFGNPGAIPYSHRQAIQAAIRATEQQQQPDAAPFAAVERDLLWVLEQKGRIDYPLSLLYPTLPILNRINQHGLGLHALHLYKIVGSPVFQLAMPIVSLLAPYFLLQRQMNVRLGLKAYFKMIFLIAKMSFRQIRGRSPMKALSTVGSGLMYLAMYAYGLVNTVEFSVTTFKALRKLRDRAQRLRAFFTASGSVSESEAGAVSEAATMYPSPPPSLARVQASARADTDMVFLYKLIQEHDALAAMADRFYAADAIRAVQTCVRQKGWCFAETATSLSTPPVEMVGMGHPLLPTGVRNGARLDKNAVITGPNAAGKSTYMRSVLLNTLLAVTLGICCARKATLGPIQAIHTQMRLVDVAGDRSLFEEEVRSCRTLLDGVHRSRPWSLVFLDEPMHSTNALDGASALKGLVERLSQMAGVRCMVTTHYHSVGDLACVRPLCMEAVPHPEVPNQFRFPYKLRAGVSRQSIALELLRNAVDDPFIELAIAHKEAASKTF